MTPLRKSFMSFYRISFAIEILLTCALSLVLLFIIFRKGLHRELPVFFTYLVLDCASQIPSFLLLRASYFWWWWFAWIDNIVCEIFFLAIVVEVFSKVFAPYNNLRRFSKTVMLGSMIIMVPLSAGFAGSPHLAHFHDEPGAANWTLSAANWLMMVDRGLTFIQLGLALTLLLLAKCLDLRWNNFGFGIVLGYGIGALISMAGEATAGLFSTWGSVPAVMDNIAGSSYCFTVLTWIYYALRPEVSYNPVPPLQSKELEQWDQTLSRMLGWATPSSQVIAPK